MLKVNKLHAGYGKLEIVHGISLHVNEEEIVTIIGPNGCGKSTFLKSIFGLTTIMDGEIIFNNKNITNMRPDLIAREGIGYVPQLDNVFPNLTVEENLEMGGYILPKSQLKERMEEVYDFFEVLREKKDVLAGSLSGGERQMLAMARALMAKPKLLLLDEPTAGLSPKMVSTVLKKIREITDMGVGILLVEQNAKKALEISDRGYVFAGGVVVYEGKASDILNHKEIGELYLGKKAL
ncbi:ABC transporter ATP-binding protein [Methanotorris igneus]|uniref:Fe(3+)-transporting ATPase n=1 Tax=Methanotorris igneus (strain DSM 5666 / JCM 11834 / Kol 5) TaxID=880724 RepID=F6BEV0_METIK|nr:ABC transporter ATP-binding protein [Methanotorris igneus]AEF95686.1 Fe(3+)-transporting ATPase [Methanotorris igneus Kol 5]